MKILLDENLPVPLRHHFPGHDVATVTWMGWAGVVNGALLDLAAAHGFDTFITADQSLVFQQNLTRRPLAILVLIASDNSLETLQPLVGNVVAALHTIRPGEIVHIAE